ncbi:hypothetical protein ANCDUO_26795 [Ancylostoma duodenale]|uniref:Uncharacterized protein n=1 Tax=Ancylostoma duodenale TaxID=51022 RepID=A0A0C2F8G1_9BILA|nr:hypothetical protein ANCDUO_26795 [Ancylostoma duodenale]
MHIEEKTVEEKSVKEAPVEEKLVEKAPVEGPITTRKYVINVGSRQQVQGHREVPQTTLLH